MKQLIGTIGDRLQAIFPPNRIMLVVAPTTTAASLWLSAWLTAHVPGVELPAGVIAGAMGVVGLIAVTLFYKWFDQWQKGEPVDFSEDLDQALAELEQATTAFFSAHGTVQGVGAALEDLHDRIAKGSINEAEIASGVAGILDVIGQFVGQHEVDAPPSVEAVGPPIPVASPAPPEPEPAPAAPAPPAE
jgi:hypothetical protein